MGAIPFGFNFTSTVLVEVHHQHFLSNQCLDVINTLILIFWKRKIEKSLEVQKKLSGNWAQLLYALETIFSFVLNLYLEKNPL